MRKKEMTKRDFCLCVVILITVFWLSISKRGVCYITDGMNEQKEIQQSGDVELR